MTKKTLERKEFDDMPLDLRFEVLHRDGVYVGKRKEEEQAIVLFQLYSFYVEIFYTKYRREVSRMLTCDDTEILQPYLEQIHVRDLNKKKERSKRCVFML
jgi:hypothetical protein